jgi:dihydrofolate reductase
MSSYWPQSDDPYAQPMNDIPKIVFSKTLDDADAAWPTSRVARGELTTEIAAIKAEPGPDVIAWGGAAFAGALAAADLIDEYRLQIPPLVLGQGKALFAQLPESRGGRSRRAGSTSPAVLSRASRSRLPARSPPRPASKSRHSESAPPSRRRGRSRPPRAPSSLSQS